MTFQALLLGYWALVSILIAYLLCFAATAVRSCRRPARRRQRPWSGRHRISVVIPAANEEALIGPCLDSVLAQDLSRVEAVIVALNGAVDGTESVVDRYALGNPKVRKVVLGASNKVAAILAAIRSAPSRHVLILDADMALERGAVDRLMRFHFGGGQSVTTCLIDPSTEDTVEARLISSDRLFRGRVLNVARDAWGLAHVPGNLYLIDKRLYRTLVRRQTLLDDNELTYQLWTRGHRVACLAEALACEKERASLLSLVRQRKRWVLGNVDTFGSYLRALAALPPAKALVGASYVLLWYVIHYALACGCVMALLDGRWRAAYLSLAGAYGGCVGLALALRPTRRTRAFGLLDALAHTLVFPWAVTAGTAQAARDLFARAQPFREDSNRESFLRDGLRAQARA